MVLALFVPLRLRIVLFGASFVDAAVLSVFCQERSQFALLNFRFLYFFGFQLFVILVNRSDLNFLRGFLQGNLSPLHCNRLLKQRLAFFQFLFDVRVGSLLAAQYKFEFLPIVRSFLAAAPSFDSVVENRFARVVTAAIRNIFAIFVLLLAAITLAGLQNLLADLYRVRWIVFHFFHKKLGMFQKKK